MIINFASNSFSLFLEIPALLHLTMHIVIIARYFVISFFFFFFFERERLFSMERIFRVDRWNDERILFVFLGV